MNYDLAMMALEGLTRSRLIVRSAGSEVVVEGSSASFKELARLCLLLGGADVDPGETVELQPAVHLTAASPRIRLQLT